MLPASWRNCVPPQPRPGSRGVPQPRLRPERADRVGSAGAGINGHATGQFLRSNGVSFPTNDQPASTPDIDSCPACRQLGLEGRPDQHFLVTPRAAMGGLGWLAPDHDYDAQEMPANWYPPRIHRDWQYLTEMLLVTMVGVFGFDEEWPIEVAPSPPRTSAATAHGLTSIEAGGGWNGRPRACTVCSMGVPSCGVSRGGWRRAVHRGRPRSLQ